MIQRKRQLDMNSDNTITNKELSIADRALELELREEKADTQRRMAWIAILSMIIFTSVLFSPMVSDSRVQALADLLGLFYIAQAGVVGAVVVGAVVVGAVVVGAVVVGAVGGVTPDIISYCILFPPALKPIRLMLPTLMP